MSTFKKSLYWPSHHLMGNSYMYSSIVSYNTFTLLSCEKDQHTVIFKVLCTWCYSWTSQTLGQEYIKIMIAPVAGFRMAKKDLFKYSTQIVKKKTTCFVWKLQMQYNPKTSGQLCFMAILYSTSMILPANFHFMTINLVYLEYVSLEEHFIITWCVN